MVPTQESHDTWTRAGIRVWTAIGALILVALGGSCSGSCSPRWSRSSSDS